MGFRVLDLGFGVWGFGFVLGFGFVSGRLGSGFRVQGVGLWCFVTVWAPGYIGIGFRGLGVWGLGFRNRVKKTEEFQKAATEPRQQVFSPNAIETEILKSSRFRV